MEPSYFSSADASGTAAELPAEPDRGWFLRCIDALLPEGPHTRTERRRMRAVVVGTVITVPFGLIAAQQIGVHIGLRDALVACAGVVALLVCPFLLRRTGSATVPGLLQASTLMFLLLLMAVLDGGLDDPSLYWVVLVPMAAAITVGPVGSLSMMIAGLVGLGGLYVLTEQGYAFPNYSAGTSRVWFDMLSLCTGTLFAALIGWLYEQHTRYEVTFLSEGVRGLRGQLGRSEERYQQLFEHLPLGMYRTKPDGEIVLANAAFLRMLGYESLDDYRRERTGVADTYVDPEARAVLVERLRRHGRVSQYEVDLRARDGRVVHVRLNARTVTDADGTPRFFEGTTEDVTAHRQAQRQLRRSEKRFRALVRHSSDVIAVLDADGCLAYLSPAAETLLGLDPDAHLGAHALGFMPAEERRRVELLLQRATRRPGPLPTTELRLQHAGGHIVFVEVTGSNRLAEPDLRGLILNLRDITDRKRAEAVLLKGKEHAEDVARFKSTFLANMSHEIRTPLTGILGFTSVLVEEVEEAHHRDFLRLIEKSGRRLLDTLNSVLDLARLEADRMDFEPEPLGLADALRDAVDVLAPQAEEKGLALDLQIQAPEACALLDKAALGRIVSNLVGNAIKFTTEGRVTIAVEADAGFVCFRVSDTGPGIDEAFLPRVFGEFEQESQGVGRHHEGAGLGLTITQRLVEKMGGGIEVRSRKGEGTTFTVTFPRSDAAAPTAAPTPEAAAAEQQRARVLVVDDNQQTRFLMERMLHADYQVDTAATAEETYRLAEEHRYDAILLDINLGAKTSGEDVMLRLREEAVYADIPIIAFTAYALPGDRERFLNQGFDGYLSKPFTRKQLNTLMREVLPADVRGASAVRAVDTSEPSLLLGPYKPRLAPEGDGGSDRNGPAGPAWQPISMTLPSDPPE